MSDYTYTVNGQEVPVPHGVCICCGKPSVPSYYPYCLDCWGDWNEEQYCCDSCREKRLEQGIDALFAIMHEAGWQWTGERFEALPLDSKRK